MTRTLVGCLTALLVAALPWMFWPRAVGSTAMLAYMGIVTPVVLFLPAAVCCLYAYFGAPSALLSAIMIALGAYVSGGWVALGAALLIVWMPCAVTLHAMRRQVAFFPALGRSVAALLFGTVCALGIAYLRYGQISEMFVALFESTYARLEQTERMYVLVAPVQVGLLGNALYQQFAQSGMTPALMESAYARCVEFVRAALLLWLPSTVLVGGVAGAIVQTVLPRALRVRMGDDVPYVRFEFWRLPRDLIWVGAGCFVLSWVLLRMNVRGFDAIYVAMRELYALCLYIQGGAALERMFKQRGMPRMHRRAMVAAGFVFFRMALLACGVYSAFLGAHGVLSEWIRKIRDKFNDKGGRDE